MIFPTKPNNMQTILDALGVFNLIILAVLAFKIVGNRQRTERLDVAIGKAKASVRRTG